MKKILILLFCALCAMAYELPIEVKSVVNFDSRDTTTNYRLPNNSKPLEYDIDLTSRIDNSDFKFSGKIKIKFEVLEKTRSITLHKHHKLEITKVVFHNKSENDAENDDQQEEPVYDKVTEFLTLKSAFDMEPKKQYTVEIDYTGELNTDQVGFYRSFYENDKKEKVSVLIFIGKYNF